MSEGCAVAAALRTLHSGLTGSARPRLSRVLDDGNRPTRSKCHVPHVEVVSVNALANAPPTAWAPPLQPSGVVKGWAVQRAAGFPDAFDETDYCLSPGGDLICHIADPVRPAWRIGIENPHDTMSLIAVVPIRSGGVATAATVSADSLTWADFDATAAYVQGRHAVRWLGTRQIRSALIVWADGTTTRLPKA